VIGEGGEKRERELRDKERFGERETCGPMMQGHRLVGESLQFCRGDSSTREYGEEKIG